MNEKLEPLSFRLLRREGNICDTLQQAYNMGIADGKSLAGHSEQPLKLKIMKSEMVTKGEHPKEITWVNNILVMQDLEDYDVLNYDFTSAIQLRDFLIQLNLDKHED